MGTVEQRLETERDKDGDEPRAAEAEGRAARGSDGPPRQDLADVLASIRQLVTAETAARVSKRDEAAGLEGVLILTPEMRVDAGRENARSGEILSEGIDASGLPGHGAPILDEEALRAVINAIVREELQGELGDRISRNLRKLIRREIGQILAEEREAASQE